MKLSSYFKTACKLIDTVNRNYSHISELEELQRAFGAVGKDSYWVKNGYIEYELLAKIAWETTWNHYHRENPSPWGVDYILEKLKTSDDAKDVLPRVDLNKYPNVDITKYL